jgi:hypothetical protein
LADGGAAASALLPLLLGLPAPLLLLLLPLMRDAKSLTSAL